MTQLIGKTLAAVAALTICASTAGAADRPAAPEARIPFSSSVRDFRADGTDAIYIQDVHRQWYRGTFVGPCHDLPFADAIGFRNRGTGGIDRWATIYARGSRCQLSSFVKSAPPLSKKARAKQRAADASTI